MIYTLEDLKCNLIFSIDNKMTHCKRNSHSNCCCCIKLPKKYWFNSKDLELPKKYKKMRKLVNCVEHKDFFTIFDNKVIDKKNDDTLCAADANNLSFLYYSSANISEPSGKCLDNVIKGFPIHQASGFTTFVKSLFLEKMEKNDVEKCFYFFHDILTKLYKNIDTNNGKNTTTLLDIIILLDITHHTLRALAAVPNIVFNNPKKATFQIIHNYLHWVSFFSSFIYSSLNDTEDQFLFELLVQNPFLLGEWFCLNGT